VFAINPRAVARYRERTGQAGAKSDARDAAILADILRTDRHLHRPMPHPSDQAVKALARQHQEAIWALHQTLSRLRSVLLEFYPGSPTFPQLKHHSSGSWQIPDAGHHRAGVECFHSDRMTSMGRPHTADVAVLVGTALVIPVLIFSTDAYPITFAIPVAAIVLLLVMRSAKPGLIPVTLACASTLLVRPSALGEAFSPAGLGLAFAAALTAVMEDRGKPHPWPSRTSIAVVGFVGTAYVWLALRTLVYGDDLVPILQSTVLTLSYLVAIALVVRDAARARMLLKVFTTLVVIVCTSYAVTAFAWILNGVGSFHVGDFQLEKMDINVYLPFTTTSGVQGVGGVVYPRFTGFAREPGWMSMWAAFGFFAAPLVLRPRIVMATRLILMLGVVGTLSTAGFAVFVVAAAIAFILKRSARDNRSTRYLRFIFGLGAVTLAVWVSQNAPILGLGAKGEMDKVSLDNRSAATQNGLHALLESPLFGFPSSSNIDGVNLVAAVAMGGIPYVLLVILAFALPALKAWGRGAAMPILVLLGMLAVAQPAQASVLVFAMAMVVAEVGEPGLFGKVHDPAVRVSTRTAGSLGVNLGHEDPRDTTIAALST